MSYKIVSSSIPDPKEHIVLALIRPFLSPQKGALRRPEKSNESRRFGGQQENPPDVLFFFYFYFFSINAFY